MVNLLAFFGTGPCNHSDIRNARIGQWAVLVIAGLLIYFVSRRLIKSQNTWIKAAGWLSVPAFILTAAAIIIFISLGVACNGTTVLLNFYD